MASMLEGWRGAWDRLAGGQKLRIAVAALATVGFVWGVVAYGTRIRYELLYAGAEVDDAAEIVAALKEQRVQYRLSEGGRRIEVPAGQVNDLRMQLAEQGLPRGGGVGFEIFDKPSFGLSSFVENVNYRRALERELARSIQSIDGVRAARVHLALPAESVFADERQEPSASVVVQLQGGGDPPPDRVRAIAHLVASGVEGLDASRVSVVDSHGRMLSDGQTEDGDDEIPATQLEAKRAMERRIESTLVTILEPVVGRSRVHARATVELETARVERVEERYDPQGAVVRSEQKNKMRNGGTAPGGVPGSDANLPQGQDVAASTAAGQESQTSTTNFEINKTISTIAEPRGRLLRQSVAVVVNHAAPAAAEGEAVAAAALPRSSEEMAKITALVRAAVGIDEGRGDVLTVENVPFDATVASPEIEPAGGPEWIGLALRLLRYLALPLAVLLVALLVIRPGIAALRTLRAPSRGVAGAPTIAELQATLGLAAQLEGQSRLRQRLIEAAKDDPESAALIVRGWVGRRGA